MVENKVMNDLTAHLIKNIIYQAKTKQNKKTMKHFLTHL